MLGCIVCLMKDSVCVLAKLEFGGAHGVIDIVTGYGHGNTSSIPGQE